MINFLFEKTPLLFIIQSFWRDEAFSYLMAKQDLISIVKNTAKDFNPPFYYFLLHFWLKIFGKGEVFLRCFSLIFFTINIYFVFLFLKDILKIKDKRIFIYLLIFSFNPFLLYYAFETRMYSLFALLATLSFYYFFKKRVIKYLIFTILGLYTHYFFLLVVFTQIIYSFFFKKKRRCFEIKKALISLTFFFPWLSYVFFNLLKNSSDFWLKPVKMKEIFSSLGILFTGYESLYRFYDRQIFLISLFFFLLIINYFLTNKQKNHLFYFLFLWAFLAYFLIFFISFIKPLFLPRYLIFASVGFNLLIFYLLENMGKRGRFLSILVIALIIFHYTKLEVVYKRKADVRKTIYEIKRLANKDDYLFVSDSNASSYFIAAYYFDEKKVYIYKETTKSIPYYIGLVLIPKKKIITKLPRYPKKAFILENDYQYRIESVL